MSSGQNLTVHRRQVDVRGETDAVAHWNHLALPDDDLVLAPRRARVRGCLPRDGVGAADAHGESSKRGDEKLAPGRMTGASRRDEVTEEFAIRHRFGLPAVGMTGTMKCDGRLRSW